MTTCDDLRHDQPLPGSLKVHVNEVNYQPTPPREIEIHAEDTEGGKLKIVIWRKHNVSGSWATGGDYEISGGRVKRYEDASGPQVRVHSNSDFAINRLATTRNPTQILLVGDTHVGYRHRDPDEKPSWAQSLDARKGFTQALKVAQEHSVDAIVHAGDVFDHKATESDCVTVTEELVEPLKSGIPFYHIRGNHDTDYGMESLQMFADGAEMPLRLNTDPISVETPTVNMFGIDHTAKNLPDLDMDSFDPKSIGQDILILHEKPYPIVDEQSSLIYDDGANVAELVSSVSINIDLIVTGHMHVSKRGRIPGYNVPVLVTGPTAKISQYKKDNRPSVWLVTVSENNLEVERIELGS